MDRENIDIQTALRAIHEKILNYINLVVAIITIPLSFASISRMFYTGFYWLYVFHVVVASLLWLIFLLRKRIRFNIRAWAFIITFMVIILPGIPVIKLASNWGYIALLYSFLAAMFFGRKAGILTVVYSFLYLIGIISYLYLTPSAFDRFTIPQSEVYYSEIFVGIVAISYSLMIILAIDRYRIFFLKALGNYLSEKKRAEESELKYRQLSDLTFEGIIIHNKGILIDANRSFLAMIGYSLEELQGKNIIEIIIPEKYWGIIAEKMSKDYVQPYEIEGKKKDGSIIPIEVESRSLVDGGSSGLRVTAVRDISRRKETEKQIKLLSMAVTQSANTIVITDPNGNIEYTNPKFTELTGYTAEEALGQNPRILNAGVLPKKYYAEMWQTISSGEIWKGEFCNKTKQGKLFWENVTITPIKDNAGRITNYLAIKEDITAKKAAQESILKFDAVANQASEGITIADETGKYVYVNPAFCEMSGYSKDELLNLTVFDMMNVPIESDNFLKKITKMEMNISEQILKRKDGTNYYAEVVVKIITINGKNFMLGIVRDVSERIENEKKLISAKEKAEESDRLKTEFLQNMSHEIRTPLNAILGFSNFLNNPDLTEEMRKNHIGIIQNSGKQLLRIIDDILEISRLETKQIKVTEEEVCLNELLLELFLTFEIEAKKRKIPLYLKKGLSDQESNIITDKSKLSKILSNLLENALKYTNEGFIECGYFLENNKIKIYIKDTGIGIAPESQQKIFDRFSQEHKELSKNVGGLGLGLSIAKENAELLGGEITLESEKGKGSSFYVTIPYKPVSKKEMKVTADLSKKETNHKQAKLTILVAEDEAINFMFLDILLRELHKNLMVLHAKNGVEAVEICKKNKGINLVLMDLKMPIMDGFEATKQIKSMYPKLPIVAQTAYTTTDKREQAFSSGCDDFISKPITEKSLKEMLDKYMSPK